MPASTSLKKNKKQKGCKKMETELVKRCSCKDHKYYYSEYERDSVPEKMFVKPDKDGLYKMCSDCRNYRKIYKTELRKRKVDISFNKDVFNCFDCNQIRTKEYCEKCRKKVENDMKKRRGHDERLTWERITKLGYCCEICKNVFLKSGDGIRFITKSSINGIEMHDIEYRNLEFDHLSEEEQINYFGKSYGPKVNGISKFCSYEAKKAESMKCMLLCLFCHRSKTRERYGEHVDKTDVIKEKYEYVKDEKIRAAKCGICSFQVYPSNLMYYEWDHLDPTLKVESISFMTRMVSLEQLKYEISKCRMLCVFCHRLHSAKQQREIYLKERENAIMSFKLYIIPKMSNIEQDMIKIETKPKSNIRSFFEPTLRPQKNNIRSFFEPTQRPQKFQRISLKININK